MGLLLIVAMPLMTHGATVQQEFQTVLQSTPDRAHGEQLFVKGAACHGNDGAGVRDGRIPAIAGQHFGVIARQLVDFRHDRSWDPLMEHYADEHNLGDTQDLADVASYLIISRVRRINVYTVHSIQNNVEEPQYGAMGACGMYYFPWHKFTRIPVLVNRVGL